MPRKVPVIPLQSSVQQGSHGCARILYKRENVRFHGKPSIWRRFAVAWGIRLWSVCCISRRLPTVKGGLGRVGCFLHPHVRDSRARTLLPEPGKHRHLEVIKPLSETFDVTLCTRSSCFKAFPWVWALRAGAGLKRSFAHVDLQLRPPGTLGPSVLPPRDPRPRAACALHSFLPTPFVSFLSHQALAFLPVLWPLNRTVCHFLSFIIFL